MARMTDVISVEKEIAAPADQVWAMVADLTRMGEWSPENTGGKWLGGATGPVPGARFRGSNRNGRKSWTTMCKVTDCEPGAAFAFDVTAVGLKVANWAYRFEPTATGCKVTETWTDQRNSIAKLFGGPASGVTERASHNKAGMEATLEGLAKVAEAGSASPG